MNLVSKRQRTLVLTPALSSEERENPFAAFFRIHATGFAGQSSEKPEMRSRCSFSPGEKVRMRASASLIST
ncbi:MAG: hypothetical protein JWM68_2144 [Verrucomicrobiales bacterium]|nr:hypothetical protein [Verrucomicrobiales bacterium]